jgi:predicted negative regulator of RcsB-dependent stress response
VNDRNDEETVELLQDWWREYGITVIAAIVIVIGGVIGWHFYDARQLERANAGAVAYRSYVDALEAFEEDRSDANRSTLLATAESLKADYAGTAYAVFAALGRARLHVIDDDLAAARTELEWARDEATSDYMRDLALVRLARVEYAAGNNQGALWALDDVTTPGMEVLTAELRGDVYANLGDTEAAAEAYRSALSEAELPEIRLLLELKLNDLGVVLPGSSARLIDVPGADAADTAALPEGDTAAGDAIENAEVEPGAVDEPDAAAAPEPDPGAGR